MNRLRLLVVPALVLIVVVAFASYLTPADQDEDDFRLGNWSRQEMGLAYRSFFAISDSAQLWQDAWEIADIRERSARVPAAPIGLTVRVDRAVASDVADGFVNAARAEFEKVAPEPRYAVVLLVVLDSLRRTEYRRGITIPVSSAQPCVVQVRIPIRVANDARPGARDQLLGSCALFARYGAPGKGMTRWLERTSSRSAVAHTASVLEVALHAPTSSFEPSNLITDANGYACEAGRLTSCRDYFNGDDGALGWAGRSMRRTTAARRMTSSLRVHSFSARAASAREGRQLAALRASLGDDRFVSLWRSDDEPAETFAAREGRSLESVLSSAMRGGAPLRPPSSRLVGKQLALLVLLTTGLAAAAIRWTPRRYQP